MRGLAYTVGTFFGCGYAPAGPGTVGSLAALAIALAIPNRLWLITLSIVLLLPGIWAAGKVALYESRKDPQIVVIDEVLGQWITLAGASVFNWKSYLAALLFFRLFDIWKPPPVRQLEALPGGTGIVMDDVMAGLYGALAIFVLDRFRIF
ncbi:MAG TPA: phosphatidylglycerophosphatase A [Bryobacteraceae bacterium]|nr:phosphatidylglycerophosphatase A [Bryobacteraceae bacterium]